MNDNNSSDPKQNASMMDQAALESFVDEMITARKDPFVNDQNREQVKVALLKELHEDVNLHLINLLSEKDQVELDELLDKNPQDSELNAFLVGKIPNIQDEVAAALVQFRQAYLLPVTGGQEEVPSTESTTNAPEVPETLEQVASPEVTAAPPPSLPPAPVAPEE